MVKKSNIILITIVAIVVIFSGCSGEQEKNLTVKPQPTMEQTDQVDKTTDPTNIQQTPGVPYQYEATEVKILEDCFMESGKNSCLLINIQFKNNNVKSLDVKLVKEELFGTSGRILGTRYDKEVGLSNLCVREAGMEFIMNANTNKNIGLCYPIIHKADNPELKIDLLINGERKNYELDLKKFDIPN